MAAAPERRAGSRALAARRAVFAVLRTTGRDPTIDRLTGVRAWRPGDGSGPPELLDVAVGTPAGSAHGATDAPGDPPAITGPRAWTELAAFAGDDPLVVPEAAGFAAWAAHLGSAAGEPPLALGLDEAAALLAPGRLALRREALVGALVGPLEGPPGPLELHAALRELVARFLALEDDVVRAACSGYARAAEGLHAGSPRAARKLGWLAALVDRPSCWSGARRLPSPEDGRVESALEDAIAFDDLLEVVRPRCAREAERWLSLEPLPPTSESDLPFVDEDRRVLDEVFERHLPEAFAREGASSARRAGQHEVARAIADVLGARELLLVHAPTGTGKTLAYLVPALLWARRHGLRVAVATYTRALQEQALDREVPRALAALARAGIPPGTRVSLLKGRDNYVCWRALRSALPEDHDGGEEWLAWTRLLLFALTDIEGDLDRLPSAPPVALESSAAWHAVHAGVVRQSRAQTACCTHADDRASCAAEVARRRAERSHVVLVNHAFALHRPEFFRHLVFDECEHLHEQAHNAWSRTLSLRAARAVLGRLVQPGRAGSRAVLDRLARSLLEGSPSRASVDAARERCATVSGAVEALEAAAASFLDWRDEEARGRSDRDAHAMLVECFERGAGEPLLAARVDLGNEGNELERALAEVAERLSALPLRGVPAFRRSLELARLELADLLSALEAWLPLDQGRPAFRSRTFYDVERDARGDAVLAARVLLPDEFLGRAYYPELESAVFLSATTWLQQSFEPALAYLGLDRAARPAEDEDREPRVVRTFRAPEVFDYSRVLVAAPRDAPPAAGDKDAFLAYVRRFVAHVAERTRGRMLVLFTNAADARRVGQELEGFFRARSIALWYQNMEGAAKEELSELFRARVDSVLLGVDTFWYGADFPGETLEHLVIVRLPYGVPDRYHHAQCAAIGQGEQRRRIYLPRALAKFRQGFGRLMRRETDRGCVYLLDGRVHDPQHRAFQRELPIEDPFEPRAPEGETGRARFVRGDTRRCVRSALEHVGLVDEVRARGLEVDLEPPPSRAGERSARAGGDGRPDGTAPARAPRPPPERIDVAPEDVPF